MSFGANLRRERELRGITLDEISRETKISVRFLEAIELERFDQLPGGVFRRAFIRTYARYIGLNEEKVLQDYMLQAEGSEAGLSSEEVIASKKRAVAPAPSWSTKVTFGLVVLLLLVASSLWYLQDSSRRKRPEQAQAKTGVTPTGLPASPAIPSSGVGGSSAPAPTAGQETVMSPPMPSVQSSSLPITGPPAPDLKVLGELAKKPVTPESVAGADSVSGLNAGDLALKISVIQETWMSLESGQSTIYSGLLYPEQSKTFALSKPLKLTLGNAGGVRCLVNNKPLLPLGKPGEVRVLMISPENYQQFLAPAE